MKKKKVNVLKSEKINKKLYFNKIKYKIKNRYEYFEKWLIIKKRFLSSIIFRTFEANNGLITR